MNTPPIQENPLGKLAEAQTPQKEGSLERARLKTDLQGAVYLVFDQNRDRLNREKITPQALEEARVYKPEEIVAQDGAFKGWSVDDEKVKAEALLRRQVSAFDILFAVEDCRNAAREKMGEMGIAKLGAKQAAAKAEALQLANAQAKAKNVNAPEITTLSAEEQAKIDKITLTEAEVQAIEDEVAPLYYDKESRTFNRVVKGTDGKYHFDDNPDGSHKTACETKAYKAVFDGVEVVAQTKDEHGHPTAEAKKAKRLLKTFQMKDDESFLLYTEEQARNHETQGLFLDAAEILEASLGSVLSYDEQTGEVTGVNAEALKTLEPDSRLGRLAIYVADYYKQQAAHPENPQATQGQDNLSTLMYIELQGIDASQIPQDRFPGLRDRIAGLKDNDSFQLRAELLKHELFENWLKPNGVDVSNFEQAMETILYALQYENLAQTNSQKAIDFLNSTSANDLQRNNILRLSQGAGERIYSKFGLDVKALTDNDYAVNYAKNAVSALEAAARERGEIAFSQEKKDAYQEALLHHLTIKNLEKYLEKHPYLAKIKRLAGFMPMGLLVIAPVFQQLLSLGVEPAQEGPGGH